MSDEQWLKHLEFCQNIITRMNHSSFLLKGWSVTLVAALFALAAPDQNQKYLVVAYFPALMFWVLDAYYLAQERKYRGLYKLIAQKNAAISAFSLDASQCGDAKATWGRAFFSLTIGVFHGLLVAVIALVMFHKQILAMFCG